MFKFNIRTQLFIAIAGTGLLLIALVLLGTRSLFMHNFQEYLAAQERERLTRVAIILADYYEQQQQRYEEQIQRGRWSPEQEITPTSLWREALSNLQRDLIINPERFSAESQLSFVELNLYTPAGNRIFGPEINDPVTIPILVGEQVTGLLSTVRPTGATGPIDAVFARQQGSALLYAGGIAILVGGFVAWLLSIWFRRRIRALADVSQALAQGNYGARAEPKGHDELSELGVDMNKLGAALESAQEQRQRMLADIAHELRTPLTVLQGEIESVQDGIRVADNAHLARLHHHVTHLTRLVNDLHQLAQSDAGALNYEWQTIELSSFVKAIWQDYQVRFTAKQLNAQATWPEQTIDILGDMDRLCQALNNIISNSVRYTESRGEVQLSLSVNEDAVEVVLEDSAPGLNASQCELLGERLYRPDSARSRAEGGSGLGLAITKAIIKAHHGSIEFEPSSLGGVRVTIQLPLHSTSRTTR
ncbi:MULTISPECIES: ATP-binding protein [Gammaproteobacteria]|uniref:ATP-binding protein n=1 Tax=Gammaproteobacteria TaxID=1236 RepID=UPI000DD002FE|nr:MULTISPECIES: ATP-binding protein [Gammaproteobacteria]RTE86539.1 HAMP domain-containing protein [Aliidiomarina sp. B3213]TCZ90906.1 HAMP domain-containing protein [Lysobacter sp. N42]